MKKTLKNFIAFSHLPEALIRATVKQYGSWSGFIEAAPDMRDAAAGWPGFCYYTDTVEFAKANWPALKHACKTLADDIGVDGVYSLIAGFNCLKMDVDAVCEAIHAETDDSEQVWNALAWFALEEVANSCSDWLESE